MLVDFCSYSHHTGIIESTVEARNLHRTTESNTICNPIGCRQYRHDANSCGKSTLLKPFYSMATSARYVLVTVYSFISLCNLAMLFMHCRCCRLSPTSPEDFNMTPVQRYQLCNYSLSFMLCVMYRFEKTCC